MSGPDRAGEGNVREAYLRLPLSFEANRGQSDGQVKFLSRGPGYTLFLTPTEAVLVLSQSRPDVAAGTGDPGITEPVVVRTQLLGANPAPQVLGLNELSGRSNYFIGNDPRNWHVDIPTYARVRYEQVYTGIDLLYYGKQGQLEYDFVVHPGADPGAIELGVQGARELTLDPQGNLIVHTAGGELTECAPVMYQEIDGRRHFVPGGYVLKGSMRVGFATAAYDSSRPLVVDPLLSYSTFLGGSSQDSGFGIAVDGSGNAYVTGETFSGDFPTANALQPALRGDFDTFVTKLNAAGSALVYSTFLGGSGFDGGFTAFGDGGVGIAVDGSGNAYVMGNTRSADFPTVNALQPALSGPLDTFVTKLNAAGSALVYSTFLGGSGEDRGFGIAVDGSGNAYITGQTNSPDFPTANALQPALRGDFDTFVTKLNAAGSALVYSTFLGGSGGDVGFGIAVDGSGNAYITGFTFSSDFPTANALQPAFSGDFDAFVTKLNAAGSAFVYSTFLGGSGGEKGVGIAVDGSGNAYVTGFTFATNFPTANPFQPASGGGTDAFVTKLNAAGSALVYSTYLGGSGDDRGNGIAVDGSGNAYVTGFTASSDFPPANPIQPVFGGQFDAFVTKLNAAGSALVYSTFLGGSGEDRGFGIAVDGSGNAYITGQTSAPAFPTANPFQPASGGGNDAFVVKLTSDMMTVVDWTRQFGSSAFDAALGVSVDASGVYVAGHADGTLPGQTSAGGRDAFIRKYDAAGNEVWTRQFGTSASDIANGVSVDASGVYVAGNTLGTLPDQTSAGDSDAFVRKYDAAGNEVWTRQFGTGSHETAFGVSVDASGVYVAGTTSGTLPGQSSAGSFDPFVRKYDAAGTEVWTRQFGTSGDDRAFGVSVDASGVYVAGHARGTLPGQTHAGIDDAFVRKYDAAGTEVWTRQFGTSGDERAFGVSVDTSGVYVAGFTTATLPGQTSAGSNDAFVRKYDAAGTEVWTRQFGSSSREDGGDGVSVDASGVYVVGSTEGALPGQTSSGSRDAFARKYDATGTEVWTRQFGTSASDSASGVSVDASGVYVAGRTEGTLPGQTSAGDADAFVAADILPDIVVAKTADPTNVPTTGGVVLFTILVTNVNAEAVTLTSLTDDVFGDLNGQGTCAVPQTLPGSGGTYTCFVFKTVSGTVGVDHVDTITAVAFDGDGNSDTATDSATVTFSLQGFAIIDDATGGDCSSIGTWDSGAKTCTLAADVNDGIRIESDAVTLDCIGHRISPSVADTGILVEGRMGVTVQNCVVSNFLRGFLLSAASGNMLLGNAATGNGIGFRLDSSNSNILSANTADGNGNGFALFGSSSNTLTGNVASGNSVDGFLLGGSSSNFLTGNTATGNSVDGFVLADSSANFLTGNTATGTGVEGFELVTSPSNVLSDNTATGNINGFRLFDSSGNTLTGNIATGNGGYGFGLVDSSGNVLETNTAVGNANDGYALFDSSGNLLGLNTAAGNGGGFALFGSLDNTLTGNTATGNSVGFFLAGSSSNTLTGNTATGNSVDGFVLHSASSANTLTGNTAGGNDQNGFVLVDSSGNFLEMNIADGNSFNGFFLGSSSDSNTLTGNTATGNSVGFFLAGSSSNTLTGNTATGNSVDGFALFGSSGNTLSGNTATDNGGDGFSLGDSLGNLLEMNTAAGNINGFRLFGSSSNVLSLNRATRNEVGFALFGSPSNTLTGNTATRNVIGFALFESSSNVLTVNEASRNDVGFELSGSSGNTLTGNAATRNTDGFLVISGSTANVITQNVIVRNVHGIHICKSLVPLNTIAPNSFFRNEVNVFVDESC